MFNASVLKRLLAATVTALALAACADKPSFTATDITGGTVGQAPWRLQDDKGVSKTVADYKGKAVVIFFGFTRCPDVCPTTLVDFAAAIKAMGKAGEQVQVLFATLDPERDTFPALQQYTSAFNPSFIALRGDEAATKAAAASFKVFYAKSKGADGKPLNYSIDHTAASFVFDPQGNLRLFVRNGQAVDSITKDLLQLVK
jgi:protein SCO1